MPSLLECLFPYILYFISKINAISNIKCRFFQRSFILRDAILETQWLNLVFFDVPGAYPGNIRSIRSSILLKLLAVAKKWVMGTIVLKQIEKGVILISSSYHVRMPINCHPSLAKRLFFLKTERFLFIQLFTVL